MKRTINVNIGSMGFIVDEDAYNTLSGYFDDIRSRLYDNEKQDIMDEVESRTAELFRENLSFPTQVVTIDLVQKAMATIGSAQTFGERRYDPAYQAETTAKQNRKFYRSRTDSVSAGICGGLAEYFSIDPTLVRILMIILLFISFGMSFWAYIILWIITPLEPRDMYNTKKGTGR